MLPEVLVEVWRVMLLAFPWQPGHIEGSLMGHTEDTINQPMSLASLDIINDLSESGALTPLSGLQHLS